MRALKSGSWPLRQPGMQNRVIVTLSEPNELKLATVHKVAQAADELLVLQDDKYTPISCCDLPATVTNANYQVFLQRYTRKIDVFNGKWSNNPAKIAALSAAAGMNSPVWVIEDDVYCHDWCEFLSAYADNNAELLASTAPVGNYPWFNRGWLVGDPQHVQFGVAALFVFRISPAAARAVLDAIVGAQKCSHHELFVPWAVGMARMSIHPLLTEHAATMRHNCGYSTACLTLADCKRTRGVIFHPVKVPAAARRRAKRW